MFDRLQSHRGIVITVDRRRDALLTDFGRATLDDRYLLPGESYQDLFGRVASADMMPKQTVTHARTAAPPTSARRGFMPATPVLSNRRNAARPAHLLLSE
jgi:ribonucleoside-diphosphate reductase alpha chain